MSVKMAKYRWQWLSNFGGEFFKRPSPCMNSRSSPPYLDIPTIAAKLLLKITACVLPSFEQLL
jgi:hypothetical protein